MQLRFCFLRTMHCWFHLNTMKFANDHRFGKFLHTQKQMHKYSGDGYLRKIRFVGIVDVFLPPQ